MSTETPNTNPHDDGLTLVLGGTGKTGRRVVEQLQAKGVPVRVGSRSGDPSFDWEDPATWGPVLQDVEAAYIVYYPDLAFPGAYETVKAFVDTAVASGVRRLVLLSGRGEPEAQRSEVTVQESGAEWTIVRAAFFSQNFSEHFLLEPVLEGAIVLPAHDVTEPVLDVDDVAEIVVEALTTDRHLGRLYEVTGPELLTFKQVAETLSAATGRDIQYISVSTEEYAAGAAEAGVPADVVEGLTALFTEIFDGHNSYLTDGVQQALGRPPKDFTVYAREAAATGIWNP
jgi:uncharacterized protein YbjT (DUF2867 family)